MQLLNQKDIDDSAENVVLPMTIRITRSVSVKLE